MTQHGVSQVESRLAKFSESYAAIREQLGRVIVGHGQAIEQVMIGLLTGGHILLEGVPGLGKTLLVRTLAECMDLKFSRVQFSPDLMPADITGTDIVVEAESGQREFRFRPGPVFANLVLADEINRATPKTQSALLEAMSSRRARSPSRPAMSRSCRTRPGPSGRSRSAIRACWRCPTGAPAPPAPR